MIIFVLLFVVRFIINLDLHSGWSLPAAKLNVTYFVPGKNYSNIIRNAESACALRNMHSETPIHSRCTGSHSLVRGISGIVSGIGVFPKLYKVAIVANKGYHGEDQS